jgi:hypothetical protein
VKSCGEQLNLLFLSWLKKQIPLFYLCCCRNSIKQKRHPRLFTFWITTTVKIKKWFLVTCWCDKKIPYSFKMIKLLTMFFFLFLRTSHCNGVCAKDLQSQNSSAKCEPQFVQKRLLALHPSGHKLISELFWFPVTCRCSLVSQ